MSDGWAEVFDTTKSRLSENLTQTFAKACRGFEMNDAEIVEMAAYRETVMSRLRRGQELVASSLVPFNQRAEVNLRHYLNFQVVR